MKVKTAIYDTLFKTIILENDNLEYIRNIINWVTGLSINNIKVLNNEILSKNKSTRNNRVDDALKCDDHFVLIEMNKDYYKGLNNRNYHNLYRCGSFLYKQGEEKFKDKKIILINFDNFDYHKKNELIYKITPMENKYQQIDNRNLEIYHINLTYLELLCYNENIDNLSNLERYLMLLLIADKKMREKIEGNDKTLKKVNNTINQYNDDEFKNFFTFTREDEIEAIKRDRYDSGVEDGMQRGMQCGIQRGIQEGMQQGIQQGMQQERNQVVKNMFNNGFDVDMISRITNLDRQYIMSFQ